MTSPSPDAAAPTPGTDAPAVTPADRELLARLAARAADRGWADPTTLTDLARALEAALGRDGTADGRSGGADVDTLTGLPGRRTLVTRMDALAEPDGLDLGVSVFAVDVDDMKRINATYGQEVGDEVLVRVAAAIRKVVRTSDLVARWADDEFLVVMQTADREAAGRRCREIASYVRSDPWETLAPGLSVTVSAGLASGTVGELPRVRDDAARALGTAQSRGGDRIVH